MASDDILAALLDNARDTVDLLANTRRVDRERSTCAAFLRCAGVAFLPDQLVRSATKPPDVLFENACFEVALYLPPGRRMHDEWRERVRQYQKARTLEELIEPYSPPPTITQQQLVELVIPIATQKATHYASRRIDCGNIDLLVYIDDALVLDPASPQPDVTQLLGQGWRSVSALLPPYAYVLFTNASAAQFLNELARFQVARWTAPLSTGLFGL